MAIDGDVEVAVGARERNRPRPNPRRGPAGADPFTASAADQGVTAVAVTVVTFP